MYPLQIRQEHFKFSVPYSYEKIWASMSRRIEEYTSFVDVAVHASGRLFRMFDTNIWIALMGAFLILYTMLYISKNYSVKQEAFATEKE